MVSWLSRSSGRGGVVVVILVRLGIYSGILCMHTGFALVGLPFVAMRQADNQRPRQRKDKQERERGGERERARQAEDRKRHVSCNYDERPASD